MKIDEILEIYVKSIELLTLYVCYLEHNCINCFILIFLKFKKGSTSGILLVFKINIFFVSDFPSNLCLIEFFNGLQ